jgi:hypothetical protein
MTIICLGLGDRKKHTRTTDKLFLQAQTSTEGAAAPSVLFPPSVGSGPASDGDTGRRISTSKEDVSTAPGPSVNHLGPFGDVLVINDNCLWANDSWRNKNAGLDHIEQEILENHKHWLWIK